MSSLMGKLKNIFAPQEEDDEEDDYEEMPREPEHTNRIVTPVSPLPTNKIVTLNPNGKMEILNFTMLSYDMTGEICSYIKARKPIIVNMEKLEPAQMQRAVDFLTGACCALNGTVEKVTASIFIFAPEHVNINPEKFKQKSILPPNF